MVTVAVFKITITCAYLKIDQNIRKVKLQKKKIIIFYKSAETDFHQFSTQLLI